MRNQRGILVFPPFLYLLLDAACILLCFKWVCLRESLILLGTRQAIFLQLLSSPKNKTFLERVVPAQNVMFSAIIHLHLRGATLEMMIVIIPKATGLTTVVLSELIP